MSRYSRYGEFGSKRLPHLKKTVRVDTTCPDEKKYFKCWYCGFVLNSDRDSVHEGEGLTYLENNGAFQDNAFQSDAFDTVEYIVPEVTGGCPLCGCLNAR